MKNFSRLTPAQFRQLLRRHPKGSANQAQFTRAFVSRDGRPEPELGEWVRVYRNLLNGQYSIQARTGEFAGKVLGYAPCVGLSQARTHVSEATRLKVKEKGQRNVHAWVEGYYLGATECPPLPFTNGLKVTYFPFVFSHFFLRTEPGMPVGYLEECWAYKENLLVRQRGDIHEKPPNE